MTPIAENLTFDDVDNILKLVEVLHGSKLHFIRIEADDVVIDISKDDFTSHGSAAARTPQVSSAAEEGVPILSDSVGVFRMATLGSGQTVKVGNRVDAGSPIGFVHTLDDIDTVRAITGGRIAEAHVREGDFVEFGQPLFKVVPADLATT